MSLQAIIMAGGEGSRLRPLTCGTPKPMVPILGKPVLSYALQLLGRHGLTEVGLTLQYLPEAITRHFGAGKGEGVNLHYVREKEPLGTAGGVLGAASGRHSPRGTFVVLSGDGLTDCDLTEAMAFHKEKGALATLVLSRVQNPLSYGVVITDEEGRVVRFVEKPGWGEVYSDTVNTGIYLLEPEALSYIPADRPYDFGKDLFPALVAANKAVYAFVSDAYWCDIGDQLAYVRAQADFLTGKVKLDPGPLIAETAQIAGDAHLDGPLYIGPGARIGPGAHVSDCAVIGRNVAIGAHAKVVRSILWADGILGAHAQARGAVLCRGVQVGAGASLLEGTALGDGAVLGARATLTDGAKVWPGKRIDPCMQVRENLVWSDGEKPILAGGTATLHSPSQACQIVASYGAATKAAAMAVARENAPAGEALYAAALSALSAQGIQAYGLGAATLPVLRNAQRLMGIPTGMYVLDRHITFTGENGGLPSKALQRQTETLYARQDFERPFSHEALSPIPIQDCEALYIGSLAATLPPKAFDALRPAIALCPENPSLGPLIQRLMMATGLYGRILSPKDSLHPWETGFRLSATGETLTAYDEKGTPEDALQTLLAFDALGDKAGDWVVPMDAPAALEALASVHGVKVRRVSAARDAWMDSLNAADPRQFALHFDGLYRMLLITARLSQKGTTLAGLLGGLPTHYRHMEKLPCPLPDRGRLLRAIAEEEASAELLGGLRLIREDGFLTVNPDDLKAEMVVIGEASTMEAAQELCGDLLKALTRRMGEMGQNQ